MIIDCRRWYYYYFLFSVARALSSHVPVEIFTRARLRLLRLLCAGGGWCLDRCSMRRERGTVATQRLSMKGLGSKGFVVVVVVVVVVPAAVSRTDFVAACCKHTHYHY